MEWDKILGCISGFCGSIVFCHLTVGAIGSQVEKREMIEIFCTPLFIMSLICFLLFFFLALSFLPESEPMPGCD